jgi:hypothetical protein
VDISKLRRPNPVFTCIAIYRNLRTGEEITSEPMFLVYWENRRLLLKDIMTIRIGYYCTDPGKWMGISWRR